VRSIPRRRRTAPRRKRAPEPPRRPAMLEAAEPFPTTRSALQGFAVDARLFAGRRARRSIKPELVPHSVPCTQIPLEVWRAVLPLESIDKPYLRLTTIIRNRCRRGAASAARADTVILNIILLPILYPAPGTAPLHSRSNAALAKSATKLTD